MYRSIPSGRAATERFSAQLPRAHWIGPEEWGQIGEGLLFEYTPLFEYTLQFEYIPLLNCPQYTNK